MLYYQVLHKVCLSVLGVHSQLLTLSQHPFSLRDTSDSTFKGARETQGPIPAKQTESKWGWGQESLSNHDPFIHYDSLDFLKFTTFRPHYSASSELYIDLWIHDL